jgi:large subunit ribosomal protein L31
MIKYVCLESDRAVLYFGSQQAGPYAAAFAERGDNPMKKGIHPEYKDATITCACGNVIKTRSTKQNIRVEICSKCHPFFTGKQKLVDSSGRVDMFKKRYGDMSK